MTEKIKILLVDDNQNFIELLKDRIEFSDTFEVIGEAGNGEKALELMHALRPDIVILDMIMPVLDGLGVLERFYQSDNADYKPKIIILSAIGQDSITTQAITLGAKYYMVKPIDFDLLIERLEQIIREEGSSTVANVPMDDFILQRRITEVLQLLGVPPHIKGFVYLGMRLPWSMKMKAISPGLQSPFIPESRSAMTLHRRGSNGPSATRWS
jgi:two-component system response regulator (stage 0 sporulation protein A)